jgi:hypothetical protein
VVKGIPQEIIDRLAKVGGTTGHAEMEVGYDYDSVCTAIDTELYKLITFEMLMEAGVNVCVNTLLTGAVKAGSRITAAITESRSGREAIAAHTYIDCTGYGDLAAFSGAQFTEPNDHPVANSMGVAGVSIEKYYAWLKANGPVKQYGLGLRSGKTGRLIRVSGSGESFPEEFQKEAKKIGLASVTTTVHDDYFMFLKLNYKMPVSPTSRDAVALAELELRRRQARAIELLREHIPGCENAFITRTSPSLCIRRGRVIACDLRMISWPMVFMTAPPASR